MRRFLTVPGGVVGIVRRVAVGLQRDDDQLARGAAKRLRGVQLEDRLTRPVLTALTGPVVEATGPDSVGPFPLAQSAAAAPAKDQRLPWDRA
ncbi:hypothetical protein BJ999_004295 [Actinomadura citrea]|uniref:Uncharacterized protein n=1 Tax=Actinomadura citrea TaxID=46158 RepID=A0A7Y9GCH6_9ACTN|nr:hypothetical protein [Actinomadura citrea]GGU11133.1 hypothetical protein GCM10010177_82380 [Actinomadura citrea]